MSKAKPIKSLTEQIDEYKNDYRFSKEIDKHEYNSSLGKWELKTVYQWNWNDSWDGQLIRDVQALEKAGFTVVSFSRKRKVTLKTDRINDLNLIQLASGDTISINERAVIVDTIVDAVGDSWYSISFKPTLSIYWKGRSSNYRY